MQSTFVVLFLGLSVLSFTLATGSDAILTRVIQEQAMSKVYTSIMLKMTHGSYGSQAGQMISAFATTYLHSRTITDPVKSSKVVDTADRLRLQAMNLAWNENKVAQMISIIGAEDVQRDYYMDRLVQLQMQALGNQVPAQLYSLVYMKFYLSYMKTMKFSLDFQLLSSFTTFYEDEIDVFTHIVAKKDSHVVVQAKATDILITNKLWTFSIFNSFTQTDLTVFYLQHYLDSMTMALSGQQQGAQYSNMWGKMISLYQTMYTYMACQSGLRGVLLTKASTDKKITAEKSDQLSGAALHNFHAFGQYYSTATSLDYVVAIYSMYAMYAPQVAQPVAAPTTTTQTPP